MKKRIDEIYAKCNEVENALCHIIPATSENPKPTDINDYPMAFDKFKELLAMVVTFSQDQWRVNGEIKKPRVIELAVALLDQKAKELKPKQVVNRIKCHVYQLGLFAEKLLTEINCQYCDRYETLYRDFMSDAQYVLSVYEYCCAKQMYLGAMAQYEAGKGAKPDKPELRECCIGKRTTMSKWDIRESVNALFWLEMAPTMKHIPYRELRPITSLVMRQAMELVGKGAIGYESIVDRNETILKQFTQISWKFINEFKDKATEDSNRVRGTKDSWTITFPLPIRVLELMNQWCNRYTHNPDNPCLYLLWYVMENYWLLSKPVLHNGNFNIERVGIEIEGYKQMKREFNIFISRENSRAFVKWPDNNTNGAWITNEGEDPGPSLERKMRLRQSKKNISAIFKAFFSELWNLICTFLDCKK